MIALAVSVAAVILILAVRYQQKRRRLAVEAEWRRLDQERKLKASMPKAASSVMIDPFELPNDL